MRIESYSQIQSLYKTSGVRKTEKAKNVSGVSDSISISSIGRDMKDALANTPDVRSELVDSVKSRVKDGTYNVSADSFAEKLLQKYQELG